MECSRRPVRNITNTTAFWRRSAGTPPKPLGQKNAARTNNNFRSNSHLFCARHTVHRHAKKKLDSIRQRIKQISVPACVNANNMAANVHNIRIMEVDRTSNTNAKRQQKKRLARNRRKTG